MKDTSELLLLGLLDMQSMHGYALNEFLEQRLRFVSDLKKPTAYRMLERLYEQGLVDREAERVGRRPGRMVYRITEQGQQRLEELLREHLASGAWVIFSHNVALLFSNRLSGDECADLLARRREELLQYRDELVKSRAAHTPGTPAHRVLDHDLAMLDTELRWLAETIADFRQS